MTQCSYKIEKSKIDLDIELASNTQKLLLPKKFPPSETIAFATHYTAAQKVGGDLYDIFALDDNTTAFAIATSQAKVSRHRLSWQFAKPIYAILPNSIALYLRY
ncbi:MAG: hypothetical protein ABF325_06120 [Lentimonas sp.]